MVDVLIWLNQACLDNVKLYFTLMVKFYKWSADHVCRTVGGETHGLTYCYTHTGVVTSLLTGGKISSQGLPCYNVGVGIFVNTRLDSETILDAIERKGALYFGSYSSALCWAGNETWRTVKLTGLDENTKNCDLWFTYFYLVFRGKMNKGGINPKPYC